VRNRGTDLDIVFSSGKLVSENSLKTVEREGGGTGVEAIGGQEGISLHRGGGDADGAAWGELPALLHLTGKRLHRKRAVGEKWD